MFRGSGSRVGEALQALNADLKPRGRRGFRVQGSGFRV